MFISTGTPRKYVEPLYSAFKSLLAQGRASSVATFDEAVRMSGTRFASEAARQMLINYCLDGSYAALRVKRKKESA